MPSVPNPTSGAPEPLERVEVRPGVVLKLNARDKAAWAAQAKSDADLAELNIARANGQPEAPAPELFEEAPVEALVAEIPAAEPKARPGARKSSAKK